MKLYLVLFLGLVLLVTFVGSTKYKRVSNTDSDADAPPSPRVRRSSKSGSSKSGKSKSPKSGSSKSPKSGSSKSPKSGSSKSPKSGSSKSPKTGSSKSPKSKSSKSPKSGSSKSPKSGSSKSPSSPNSPGSSKSSASPNSPDTVPKIPTTTTTKPTTTTTTTTTTTLATTSERYKCIDHTLINKPICSRPRDPGPCKTSKIRYYFDEDKSDCLKFEYGGCKGNDNNFETYEECKDQCPRAYCHPEGCNPDVMNCDGFLRFCYVEELQCIMCQCFESSLLKKIGGG
ncbi:uncharacterized protein LOC144419832 [Styela clava]